MGTEIHLEIGAITLDWSKNHMGSDHGWLYQAGDLTHLKSKSTNYDYCRAHGIDTEPIERALSRPLRAMVARLELHGWSLARARAEYEAVCAESMGIDALLSGAGDVEEEAPYLSFTEFVAFLQRYPIESLSDTVVESFDAYTLQSVGKRFADDPDYHRLPRNDAGGYSEAGYFGSLIHIVSTYSVMRLLAEVPQNLDLNIVWRYGPLVHAGWAVDSDFVPGVRRAQTFLIATEGSSDVHILKHAISLVMPEVSDFFKFIDVSERHPFSGTGSLVRFAEGLKKIDVQNRLLFIFDNDVEGCAAFDEVLTHSLPSNMRAMVLPDLEEFSQFCVFGPQGVSEGDINHRAAAIECYLDLNLREDKPARVTWTNYKKERQAYQGSLDGKERYTLHFLKQTAQTIADGSYDLSKLRAVLNSIFIECCEISAHS